MQNYDVIINGGGPVGTGLAIELGQRGIRTCLVERYPQPQPIPKGQNLTQRTCEQFAAWHCEAEIRAAHPLPADAGIGGMSMYGTLLSEFAHDWFNRASVRAFFNTANARLPQYKTEAVLRARAAEIDAITVLYGWSGQDLSQDAEGVSLKVQSKDGEEQVLRAKYLVGADGSGSFTRSAAGLTQTKQDHDRRMVLLVFESEELHSLLNRYPGKAIYKVVHPDLDGYWLFFGRVDHGKSWFFHAPVPIGTTKETLDVKSFLTRAVGQAFSFDVSYVGFWDLRIALADQYRRDRVFIAGDAAHSHPPYGGYGVNTGLEDARNLGWKLAATLQGWGSEGLLNSYDAERRPVFASTAHDFIERYIRQDREFLRNFNPEKDRAAFEAEWIIRNKDTWDVDAFEPNYAGSPVVAPEPGAHPSAVGQYSHAARPGHHLSPQKLADGRSVFDALSPEFTLLANDPAIANAFQTAAAQLDLPLKVVSDLSEDAVAAYGQSAVLVRPDEYVAWAGDDASGARDILARAIGRDNAA